MNEYSFIINKNKLVSEKTLVYYDLPLMFVCHDDNDSKYLVLCTDSDELSYIVVTTSVEKIIEMMEQKISMDKVFTEAQQKWRIKAGEKEDSITSVTEFEESELPEKNALFSMVEKSNEEYLNKLKDLQTFIIQYKVSDFNILNIKKEIKEEYTPYVFFQKYEETYTENMMPKVISFFYTLFKNFKSETIVNDGNKYEEKTVGGIKYGYKFAI